MIYTVASLALLAASALGGEFDYNNSSLLVKRDPSAVRATRAFQNCVVRDRNYHTKHPGGAQKCNPRIQMAECYVNARVMNQVFATFMPDHDGIFEGEGGWYGECCAYNIYPTASEIGEVANANYACFTWETSDKKQGLGPPTMPKTQMIPYPVVCPSNLKLCYSQYWYTDDTSKMASSEGLIPTFTGVWNSPKAMYADGHNHWLWCHHRCGGCKLGNWHDMQTANIKNLKCDYDSCKKYKGNIQPLNQLTIEPIGTFPAIPSSDAEVCKAYKDDDPTEGTPGSTPAPGQQGGKGSSGSGSGSSSGSGGSSGKGSGGGSGSEGYGSGGQQSGSGSGSGSGSNNGASKGSNGKGSGGQNGGQNGGHQSGGGQNGGESGHGNGHKDKCDPSHKREQKQHKHKKSKKCPGEGNSSSSEEEHSSQASKREDSLLPVLRRHHIKEQRRRTIF